MKQKGSIALKKKFWAGFLTGAVCTVLIGLTGINVYRFAIQYSIQHMGEDAKTQSESAQNTTVSAIGTMAKVTLLEQYIDTYYLNEVDREALENGIYKGVIDGLGDKYSTYYTKEEYKRLSESTSGIYCGIGARVLQEAQTGVIMIVEPFEGGPAAKAGMLPGDIIYSIEGEEVTGEDLNNVVAKMKGKAGTTVKMTVMREGKEIEMLVERAEIKIPTVAYEMLDDEIGYIKVSEFDEVTAEQFRSALSDLEDKGEKGLIIDLRNNGGGRLTAVVDMLDRMLPEGIIVSTKEKSGKGDVYKSTDKEKFEKPLAVLINGNSASASEVFAGAIQDYEIGKLVGTTSFGKGIVQTIFNLQDGTAVKLTTSEYFTPKGRNIHGTGLEPDVYVELDEELQKQITIEKEEDNQLSVAVKTVKEEMK